MINTETKHWSCCGYGKMWKRIRGTRYMIEARDETGDFGLWHNPNSYEVLISIHPTLADAKRAAHDHARDRA